MGFLLPCLVIVFFGLMLRAWWKSGRVPTVLTFEADRTKSPGLYWTFYSVAVLAWCFAIGFVVRGIFFPETAPQLHKKMVFGWGWRVSCTVFFLFICLFAWQELRDFARRKLLANIEKQADDLTPMEDGWGLEQAGAVYRLRELKQLRAELLRMPKGYRRVADAMKKIERDWK